MIVKPDEDTPLSCFRFVELLREAGLPEDWCQPLVVSELEVATQLVTDARVGFFSFIGSARVDWMPFAGLRQSGMEVGGIPYSFEDMQVEKLLVVKSNALS